MDRVLLKQEDVKTLFDWCSQHKDLVRGLPAPLKSVEILFAHHDWQIKGIREDKWLTLYVSKGSQHFGKLGFEIVAGQLVRRKGKVEISRGSFDTMLTCYCSLMAFMVYEKPELVESDEPPAAKRKNHRYKSRPAKKRTTYILRQRTAATRGAQGGHHASPKGVFTVRGHYRKYRSGKTVWIAEYKKGTGEKKSKTYKIGGGANGEVLSRKRIAESKEDGEVVEPSDRQSDLCE